MIAGWKRVTLEEVAPSMGATFPAPDDLVWNLSLDEVEPVTGKVAKKTITQVSNLGSSKCAFDERHVLYSKLRPYLNKVVLPDQPGVGTSELIPLLPSAGSLDREFLAFYLRSPQFLEFTRANTRGANLPRIAMTQFWAHSFPIPDSLSKQRGIVARIKECMERVEEVEKLRAEAEADRNSLLQALIDAELDGANGGRHAFADVCFIQSALIDPTGTQFLESIHVGGANIESGTGVLLNLKTSREEKLKSSKFPFNSGMVLYNKIRPYLRKVARPEFEGICSADMYPLLPDKQKLLKDYLFYILLSGDFTRYAIQGSNRAGMPKVNREHLFKYVFTLPSIDQQKVICTKLDQAFSAFLSIKQELSTQEQSEKLLRDAILRKAFSGEL